MAKLLLSKNRFENEGACLLAKELVQNHQIVQLCISNNAIGRIGGEALLGALTYNQSIVDLDLSSHDGLHRN